MRFDLVNKMLDDDEAYINAARIVFTQFDPRERVTPGG